MLAASQPGPRRISDLSRKKEAPGEPRAWKVERDEASQQPSGRLGLSGGSRSA
jgi:hypothetical protein